jgi:hypothetical protein
MMTFASCVTQEQNKTLSTSSSHAPLQQDAGTHLTSTGITHLPWRGKAHVKHSASGAPTPPPPPNLKSLLIRN